MKAGQRRLSVPIMPDEERLSTSSIAAITPTIIQRNIGAPVGSDWRSGCWFLGGVEFMIFI
jgi:hypothetical protein